MCSSSGTTFNVFIYDAVLYKDSNPSPLRRRIDKILKTKNNQYLIFNKRPKSRVSVNEIKNPNTNMYQGGRGHLAAKYTSPQSFIVTFSYSLA